MEKEKLKSLFWEVFRFGIVGGISFIVDTGVFMFMNRIVFGQPADDPNKYLLIISTAIGFILGLLTNYILSRIFVFTTEEQKERGKGKRAFILFTVISVIGLLLTEVLVQLFILFTIDLYARIFAAAIVMVWNYLGRKIFIFK